MSYQSVNPYNGTLLKTFEHLNDKQVEAALEGAAVCFERWRQTSFAGAGGCHRKGCQHHARPRG